MRCLTFIWIIGLNSNPLLASLAGLGVRDTFGDVTTRAKKFLIPIFFSKRHCKYCWSLFQGQYGISYGTAMYLFILRRSIWRFSYEQSTDRPCWRSLVFGNGQYVRVMNMDERRANVSSYNVQKFYHLT